MVKLSAISLLISLMCLKFCFWMTFIFSLTEFELNAGKLWLHELIRCPRGSQDILLTQAASSPVVEPQTDLAQLLRGKEAAFKGYLAVMAILDVGKPKII